MDKFDDVYESYSFLEGHPIYRNMYGVPRLTDAMSVSVGRIKVNNGEVDKLGSNSRMETFVMITSGPFDHHANNHTHDPRLNVREETFEKAIISLANVVAEIYGEYVYGSDVTDKQEEIQGFFESIRSSEHDSTRLLLLEEEDISCLEGIARGLNYKQDDTIDKLRSLIDKTKKDVRKVLNAEVEEK